MDSDKELLAFGTQPERSPKLPLFRLVSPLSKTLKFGGTEQCRVTTCWNPHPYSVGIDLLLLKLQLPLNHQLVREKW